MAAHVKQRTIIWSVLLVVTSAVHIQVTVSSSLTTNATVILSSNSDTTAMLSIRDANDSTMWQSGACFPTGYTARPQMNALYTRCNVSGACSWSGGYNSFYAFDGNMSTSATVKSYGGRATLKISLRTPMTITRFGLRGVFPAPAKNATTAATVWLYAVRYSGALQQILAVNSSASNQFLVATGTWQNITGVFINATSSFILTEVAAQYGPCFESASVDLGAEQYIGSARVRYWPGPMGVASWLLVSVDGLKYTDLMSWMGLPALNVSQMDPLMWVMPKAIKVRYIMVKHQVAEVDYAKVYVWGIDAWPPPPPSPPPPSPPPRPPPP
ncbi:hypothetical protein Vretifemale_3270, partial [Volvox reticuliferus]